MGMLAAILLFFAAALDSNHYHHYAPHEQIQYDGDFQQVDGSSIDSESQKVSHSCEDSRLFSCSIPDRISFVSALPDINPITIFLFPSINARAPPYRI